ncbi:MAG: efflux transporter outer membrane subunit [Acidobacteriota bacterium]|nr:efflux transporter outer membrane subunit [Acidobacteriota bacterium]
MRSHPPLWIVPLLLLLAGCALDKPPEVVTETVAEALPPETAVPEKWTAPVDSGKVDDGWVASFGDDKLTALVKEAVANNLQLQAAAAGVDAATARTRQARSALKPAVGLGGSSARAGGDDSPLPDRTTSGASLEVSWEVDVWGRVRAGVEAAEESLRATVADFEFARQSLAAGTSRAWFMAVQAYQQRELAREGVELFRKVLELVEIKERIGKAAPQDVHLARADLASSQEALQKIENSYEQALRGLEVLLGRYPSGDLETTKELSAVPPPIPAGLPSEILERRPDLIAAERRLAAAFYLTQQAEAAKLPRFNLTGSVGTIDSALTDIINPGSPMWDIGAGIYAPLYQGGALQAGVEVAEANQRAALAAFGAAALNAFQEVENALANEKRLAEREKYLNTVVDENAEALRIIKAQYDVGRVELLNLLQVQARMLAARSQLIAIRGTRLDQRITLHLALGGSFEKDAE